ncbi:MULTISPECIES: aldehyde dehydrogenase [Frankia]|uniref:Aldehyde dehydrogenase n=1 Tax=Frankia alni (strain DSM 45986 / CECT 9034 / ACN14a) TaxID=326424 RepID=Q0RKA3_FRAAA|nr:MULTISPECIES: aldehyde dehydrogenase [Frankia]CAJ62055.1 aldehyde dehydrogenase [Frankia alni ACN14a]
MTTTVTMRIGAERRAGTTTFDSIDPYTGEAWATVAEASRADVDDAVAAARAAFDGGEWSKLSGRERGRLMRRLAAVIEEHADELGLAETRDNGKLLREMGGQVRSLSAWYEYYAGLADKIDGRVVDTGRPDYFGFVTREPIGVVGAVLPWNSPLLLLTFKIAPALAAGCTIVAKPSEQAPVSILKFADLFEEAGFPPGVFNTVSGASREVGEWLVGHPGVDRVSFTGSEITGAAVAAAAAKHLAPVTLELGGKSANIVFPDADLAAASNGLIAGIFAAAGQTCIAGSRALVHADVYEEVVARVAERAARIRLGDPKDPETEMGPICFPGQHEKIRRFVAQAKEQGADIVGGGGDGGLGGLFFEPTIVANVTNDAMVCQEEIFGPVLSVLRFSSEEEAIAIANDSRYGLAAGIWTADIRRAFRMTKALRVGTVWVNAYRTLNYAMPFGGIKSSGFGRENGTEGLHEYLQEKAVWIETTGATRDPFVLG